QTSRTRSRSGGPSGRSTHSLHRYRTKRSRPRTPDSDAGVRFQSLCAHSEENAVTTHTAPTDPGPLWAAHTHNFPALLRRLGASLLVTTYQAGKLVMVRDEGDHLNTHYRTFKSPMGLALANGGARLALGTTIQVWEFRDVPDVARRLEP